MIHDLKDYNRRAEKRRQEQEKEIKRLHRWSTVFTVIVLIDVSLRIYNLFN